MNSGIASHIHQSSYQPGDYGSAPGGYAPQTPPPAGWNTPELATPGQRFLAYLIDGLIPGVIVGIGYVIMFVFALAGSAAGGDNAAGAAGVIGMLLACVLFFAAFCFAIYNQIFLPVKTNGQSMGKRMMKIRIAKQDGTSFGYGDAFLRQIVGYWISSLVCYLGFLWILFDPQKQGWHDKIFKTFVVKA